MAKNRQKCLYLLTVGYFNTLLSSIDRSLILKNKQRKKERKRTDKPVRICMNYQ